jgi:hypothetical protein
MKTMLAPTLACLALAGLSSACLVRDVSHVVHIYPDGSARWTIRQDDIRSDQEDRAKAREEELAWVEAMRLDETPEQRLLVMLDPVEPPTSLVLDDEAPMAAWLEADYASIEDVARRFAMLLDKDADVEMKADGLLRTLTIRIDSAAGDDESVENALGGSPAIDSLRLVLDSGRFVHAEGFVLSGGTRAELDTAGKVCAESADDGKDTWSLSWSVE